jgi:hypothetical protein
VDDEGEVPAWRREGSHVAGVEDDGAVRREMRVALRERLGRARQRDDLGPQAEPVDRVRQRLEQPPAEEARSSGQEDPAPGQRAKRGLALLEDEIEVADREPNGGVGHAMQGFPATGSRPLREAGLTLPRTAGAAQTAQQRVAGRPILSPRELTGPRSRSSLVAHLAGRDRAADPRLAAACQRGPAARRSVTRRLDTMGVSP